MSKPDTSNGSLGSDFHQLIVFTDEIHAFAWMKLSPSGVEPDFIPGRDFIIENDFTRPKGWI